MIFTGQETTAKQMGPLILIQISVSKISCRDTFLVEFATFPANFLEIRYSHSSPHPLLKHKPRFYICRKYKHS
jgi:hypothetical protein